MKLTLSNASQGLILEFENAAKQHGWQEDQGTGQAVTDAETRFNEAKEALEARVFHLEKINYTLRKQASKRS